MPKGKALTTDEMTIIKLLRDKGMRCKKMTTEIGWSRCVIQNFLNSPENYGQKKSRKSSLSRSTQNTNFLYYKYLWSYNIYWFVFTSLELWDFIKTYVPMPQASASTKTTRSCSSWTIMNEIWNCEHRKLLLMPIADVKELTSGCSNWMYRNSSANVRI